MFLIEFFFFKFNIVGKSTLTILLNQGYNKCKVRTEASKEWCPELLKRRERRRKVKLYNNLVIVLIMI